MGFKFYLQEHGENTKKTKHTCPQCGQKYCFTYYVYLQDGEEKILDEKCGRCDHENQCGYHKPPRELFSESPDRRPKDGSSFPPIILKPKTIVLPDNIDSTYVIQTQSTKSNLCSFLWKLIPDKRSLSTVLQAYFVGATKYRESVFWQIDRNWDVRSGKIIKYNPYNGHRIKNCKYPADWVHSRMRRLKLLPDVKYNLQQCLFGEHLLPLFPDLPVAIVESEKTAILCSLMFPSYLWLATGGLNNMSREMLSVLYGRSVVLIPDIECYEKWSSKMKNLPDCFSTIFDILELNSSPEDHANKIDIGDLVVDWFMKQANAPQIQQLPKVGLLAFT